MLPYVLSFASAAFALGSGFAAYLARRHVQRAFQEGYRQGVSADSPVVVKFSLN